MGKVSMAPKGRMALALAALALASLIALAGACSSAPTEGSLDKDTNIQSQLLTGGPGQAADIGIPTEAEKPVVAINGCVACHTSSEDIKRSAAPPPEVVKSAEQSGEG